MAAMKIATIEALATSVEIWCREHKVAPANGQASTAISPRNVRYYRSLGLLDAPAADMDAPYGEKHFLQLTAIRLLQARGVPLTRIQQLLMGRSLDDLRRVKRDGLRELTASTPSALPAFSGGESWRTTPISDDWLLISRTHQTPTPVQLAAIRDILSGSHARRTTSPAHL